VASSMNKVSFSFVFIFMSVKIQNFFIVNKQTVGTVADSGTCRPFLVLWVSSWQTRPDFFFLPIVKSLALRDKSIGRCKSNVCFPSERAS